MSLLLSISLPRFLQVAHSSTACPAEGLCCTYRHGHAPAHHKPTPSGRELHRQHRVTKPNFSLQVKELCKLFLGFIYLLLIGQRMLLLPFTPAHMGKAMLSSYTKRSAHPHGDFSLKKKECRNYLKKSALKWATIGHYKHNNISGMKSLNIRNSWNELSVQFQFSHLTGKNYNTSLVTQARTAAVRNSCSFHV